MEEEVLNPVTPQEFSSKIKAKYPQYKDIDDISLAKKMVEKYPEYSGQVDFGLKKKDESNSTYRKNLLELVSKPKKKVTSLVTDPQKKVSESGSLGGITKHKFGKVSTASNVNKDMKQFSGKLSNTDLQKAKETNKAEANIIEQPSENKRDGFLDYLSDTADVGILSVEKFLVDTPEMVYDLASQANVLPTGQIDRVVTEATGITPFKRMQKDLGFENIPSNVLKEKIDGLNQRIQAKSQDYGGDPLTAIENGRYSDAAKLIVGSTFQSAPMMAIAIGTGGGTAGLASIGVLTASGKYKENQEEKGLSQNQRLLNAVGSGVLESTLGHFFSGASGAVAKKILQDKGTELGSKIIGNSFRNFAEKNILKSPVVGLFGEFFEETAVDAGEQLNDIAVGLRDSFDGKRAINAGISSLGMGSTNTVSVYGAKAYMSAKKYNQVKRTNRDITRLQDEINKEGISEESRKIFQIKSDELIANNKRLLGEEVEKLKTLPSEDKALLNKTNAIINDVKSSIDTIKEDKTLSPDAKKIAVAEIYKDYVEAEKTKKQILSKLDGIKVEGDFTDFNGVPLDFDIETSGVSSLPIKDQNRLNKEALASLNAELNPTGMEQVDITGDMVSKRASELYGKEVESTSQQIQTQEMSSPIQLQEGEELFSVNEDKGRTFTYTSQTSENNGIKTTKFQFNRSDKDPSQRNATYVPSEEFFNKYNYEIDESYIPEGAKAVGVMEVREGDNSTAATIVFEKNVDGNAQRFDGEVVLKPKNSNESNVKVEELRSQEQTELKEALPYAEVNTEGKVDREKLSTEDQVVFDGIYNKYDKLISPLLNNQKSDYKAIAQQVLDKTQLNTVRASLRASSPDSFTLEVLDAIAKGESTDFGDDSLNQAIDDAIQNGVSINTVANLIMEDDGLSDNKGIDSKRKAIDYALNIGGKGTILKAAQEAVSNNQTEQQAVDNSTQTLTEEDLPGYDRMMSETDGIVEKSKKRRVNMSKIADNVMSYVTGSKVYEDATDVQREALVRDVRSRFGIKEKSAPSANRIIGNIQDVKKITISEKTALKKQITDKAKGAKDAIKAQKEIAQQIAKDVKELAVAGTITAKQAANVVSAFSRTNVFNEGSVDKFTNYTTKVFENAEYQDKIDNANKLISSVKKKLKSKDIDPDIKDLAKKLVSIKPSNIEDIDQYIQAIDNVDKNIKGSTARGGKLNVAEGIDKTKLSEYIDSEVEKARELEAKEVEDSFYEMTGLNPDEFSYEEMQDIMYNPTSENKNKYDDLDLRGKVKKASDSMKGIVSNILDNGIDSFTGEVVELSSEKKNEISKLLDVNVDELSKEDSLLYLDILNDIIVNGDSNKMKLFNIKVDANNAAKKATSRFSAKKVKLFGINSLGRAWNEQIASLPLVSESMFKSIEKGEEFLGTIGFDNIRKGTNKATREVNSFFKVISDTYRKTTPNGQDFTSKFNDHERGMTAFMIMSTDDSDFSRNKRLIEGSINNLSKGDSDQVEMAKSHKEVYDKILKDSNSVEDVISKADAINVNAVNDFVEFNKTKYAEKEDVSKSIYNSSLLDKENYTATSYKKISPKDVKIDDIDAFDSSILSSKEKIYDKKSGTFIESKKPTTVNDGSFISLDFLSDNERKMKESLVDTYTAGDIQFMKAFINSDYMSEIIPDKRDRDVFIDRIKEYVKIKRNRQIDISPEAAKEFSRLLDKTSRLAVSRSLGGFGQAVNQTIPVATSTLINSQRLDIIDAVNSDWNSLIDNSGYDIANRGLESASDYAAFTKILEQSNENKLDKVVDLLSKGQEFWLKTFLGKPDVFIARASWISFYKKGLQQQGKSIDIDPKTHEINDEAARYAQAQVDRQQNPSDPSLEGKWLSSKNSGTKISRAIILPFAKFALNQKSRMYNDARILSSLSSSNDDKMKSALSLIGLSAEMYMFSLVSSYVRDLVESGVDYAMGYEEDEKDKKKADKKKKEAAILSFTSNVISPFPLVDFVFQEGVGKIIDEGQDYYEIPKEERIDVKPFSDSGINKFGTVGISLQGLKDIPEYESLISEGKFKSSRGSEKQISKEDLETLRALRTPFYLNQMGLLPREVSYSIKKAVKIAKERADNGGGSSDFGKRGTKF